MQRSIAWASALLCGVSILGPIAQAQESQGAIQQQAQVAEGCLADLQRIRARISEEGVWAAGWSTSPYGVSGAATEPAPAAATRLPETEPSTVGAVEAPGPSRVGDDASLPNQVAWPQHMSWRSVGMRMHAKPSLPS